MVIHLYTKTKTRIIIADMYSLPLLGATALVLFGGRALIRAARAWMVNHKSAIYPCGVHVSQISPAGSNRRWRRFSLRQWLVPADGDTMSSASQGLQPLMYRRPP